MTAFLAFCSSVVDVARTYQVPIWTPMSLFVRPGDIEPITLPLSHGLQGYGCATVFYEECNICGRSEVPANLLSGEPVRRWEQ